MRKLLMAATGMLATCLLGTGASAAGFPQPAGEGQAFATLVLSHSDKAYNDGGHSVDIADFDQTNVYLLAEYGVTKDLTAILAPSYRDIHVDGPGRDDSGLNFVEVGGRYRFASAGSVQLSLQGTVRIPGETYRDSLAQVSQQGAEYDIRGTAATGFGPGGSAGFVIVEGGYRFRNDEPPNEFHADVTVGVRAAPRLLLLGNLFNTISDGDGRGPFRDYRYHNLYLTAVYDLTDRLALQVGGHATLDGENALRERGFVAGLWVKF